MSSDWLHEIDPSLGLTEIAKAVMCCHDKGEIGTKI